MFNNNIKTKKIPKIFQNISNLTILNKLKSLDKNNQNINKRIGQKSNLYKDKKVFNSKNNKTNFTYNQLYIPKDNILRILVKYYNKNEINKTQNIIVPLRNKICSFQEKHDKISKEIEEIDKETKPFIKRYKLSGLLTPKNNSQFLKLGVEQKSIDKFDYLGYKMNDIINKTNIFDKSLLLNKEYDNFVKYVNVSKDPEILNDTNFINKINDSLIEKKNSELFEMDKMYDIKRTSKYNIFNKDKEKQSEEKISRIQLLNTFNDINKTLKMITAKSSLNHNKRNKIKNNKIKNQNNINIIKNEIKSLNNSINNLDKEKNIDYIFNKENHTKKIINCLTPNNETLTSFNYNSSTSTSFLDKTNYFTKFWKEKYKQNKNFYSNKNNNKIYNYSFSLPSSLNNINTKDKSKILPSFVKYNTRLNGELSKHYSLMEKCNSENKIYDNNIPKKITLKNIKSEKRKSNIEPYNNIKYNFLQRIYKNIQLKSFNENKKDISDYLQIYKGINIREPNFEKGSKLYNIINDFLNKTSSYNLPYEINKIRNKTNVFDYKKSFQFDNIKKLNNKINNLIYDSAEDILDLNNDIKNIIFSKK